MDFISTHIVIPGHVTEVRDAIHRLCAEYGFPRKALEEIDIIATEMATNLIKHEAVNPNICYRIEECSTGPCALDLMSVDDGPGIASPDDAIADGYSSHSSSMGVGLGSMKRLSDTFELRSSADGTVIRVRKYAADHTDPFESTLRISVLTRPHPLEHVCGDGYFIKRFHGGACIAVIDGLGHGIHAREASACAETYLETNFSRTQPLDRLMRGLGEALRHTRGAVAGICVIDEENGELQYAGVGDVTMHILPKEDHCPVWNVPGVLGMQQARIITHRHRWNDGYHTLIMHSDGISSRMNEDDMPMHDSPVNLAHFIMNEYRRGEDDATVMVVK